MEFKQFKRTLRQVLLLPIVACLLLACILFWQIRGANSTVGLIEQADQRIALATLIEKLVVDEETGLRGYQTTSDPRFLQPYHDADAPMQQAIVELQSTVKPAQKQLLDQFIQDHQTWHSGFAEPLIATIAAGGHATDVDLNLHGTALMNSMRDSLKAIMSAAEQSRKNRIVQWRRQTRHLLFLLIGLALAIGLLIGVFTRVRLTSAHAAFRHQLDLQRRRSEEIFESEQNLRTTLASIGDGVIACDTQGRVQMMNLVAQELTGWTESESRNLPLDQVFHIVDEITRQPVENPVVKVQRQQSIVAIPNHTTLIRKDGAELSVDDSAAPIRNAAGQITGIVMVFRDITVELKTRAALLANEKLAVAGRLAATIAHEIHNPLDSVANLLYLLQHEPKEEESKQFLQMAHTELARVTQISRAMLSLYRESTAPVSVNLKEMLDDLLLLMQRRFQILGVTVSAELPPEIAVEGFPAELRQVFTNLIANAAEAAGQGGNVTIRAHAQPDGAASDRTAEAGAIVEIIDNGPGILPENRTRIFQPFFTTKGEKGTGLGLWVSQGIIRKHAGAIDLDSRTDGPNHGTTARVFLASKPVIRLGGN
ncbi:MAG: ATP-binding protein [Acidobacteriaceae bacterium]